jgi:hypothetical protein
MSNKLQTSQGLNPHLTGSSGIENKRGRRKKEWNPHSFDQLVLELVKIGRKEGRSRDPNQLAVLHDLGAESAQDCPFGP